MTIKILLVDDHNVVRQSLKMLIDADPEFEVIGEASDGQAALALVKQITPDIILLDLMIPKLNGLDVTKNVRKSSPKTKIAILSMHSDEAYVVEAFKNGASAYVLKNASSDELMIALRRVSVGMRYLSPPLSDRAIDSYIESSQAGNLDPYDTLTGREREVLQLVVEGETNALIAEQLFISPRTVETHRANMMRKLNVHSTAALVSYTLARGIEPFRYEPERFVDNML